MSGNTRRGYSNQSFVCSHLIQWSYGTVRTGTVWFVHAFVTVFRCSGVVCPLLGSHESVIITEAGVDSLRNLRLTLAQLKDDVTKGSILAVLRLFSRDKLPPVHFLPESGKCAR